MYLSIPYDDWDKPAPASARYLTRRRVQHAGLPSEEMLAALTSQLQEARNLTVDVAVNGKPERDIRNGFAMPIDKIPVWMYSILHGFP